MLWTFDSSRRPSCFHASWLGASRVPAKCRRARRWTCQNRKQRILRHFCTQPRSVAFSWSTAAGESRPTRRFHYFSKSSETCQTGWRMTQSDANRSPPGKFPDSRENQRFWPLRNAQSSTRAANSKENSIEFPKFVTGNFLGLNRESFCGNRESVGPDQGNESETDQGLFLARSGATWQRLCSPSKRISRNLDSLGTLSAGIGCNCMDSLITAVRSSNKTH